MNKIISTLGRSNDVNSICALQTASSSRVDLTKKGSKSGDEDGECLHTFKDIMLYQISLCAPDREVIVSESWGRRSKSGDITQESAFTPFKDIHIVSLRAGCSS
eukprot:TRINITY_DN6740_c0_g1_i1.p1 TRINITY_DN6740_c0_g1~~TRINITY_DN6740_c0_g1_i1.p1  ORF type:complete len:104 (+),score=7.39 TRINITY_DN6740_c0_g1_i1:376-687(+)